MSRGTNTLATKMTQAPSSATIPIQRLLSSAGRIHEYSGSEGRHLLGAAQRSWDEAVDVGEIHGVRNSQASVLAPTGTIGLMMDCDTTGIEPDLALTKAKKLVGGGTMLIVNQTIPRALAKLGYSPEQVVTPGEELWVKIIDLDLARRRISLSIKQAAEGGIVAAEYQEHFGEHAYDDEGNYIGTDYSQEEAWSEYYEGTDGEAATPAEGGEAAPAEGGLVQGGPAAVVPDAVSLADVHPSLRDLDSEQPATALGLASDQYVLEDWTSFQPTGGGDAILSRVGANPQDKVVVTF